MTLWLFKGETQMVEESQATTERKEKAESGKR